ncbi:protein EFFECTOR OF TRANSCRIPTION 2-like [Melia azedarach]|uniref:Protein EFFECTOR OF TRANSCRIPTION 2-like n=1 Tax=Melia azedarach TaxID=155640 RepID=A0ACC1XBH5_MELAZ|nr:protein EFFECTOR OF TRANSCRIPTION 2-like [Melia azedarach]
MGAVQLAVAVTRTKREECKRTKHDSHFSNWKVLVGPSDWEDHSLGKEGADRYRVHNLPTTSGPGLYELGITVSRTDLRPKADKLDSDGVVVVYLGQADNVRTRLQCYGRSGAHLNNANDGLGCFHDIFSRGHSIVYRWAPMEKKAAAVKTESELLNTFDYAWNKGGNGTRRHDDVLQKLNKVSSNYIQFPKTIRKLLYISQKPAGITIKTSKLPSERNKFGTYADDEHRNFFSEIFKFTKSRPRLVLDKCSSNEDSTGICGVSLGDGFVCRRPPVEGRKRCSQHKGLRISGSNPLKLPVVAETCPVGDGFSSICGVELDDGSLCRRPPVQGNKRCEEHKWRKTNGSTFKTTETSQYVHDAVFDSNPCSGSNFSEMYRPEKVQPKVSSNRSATKLQIKGIKSKSAAQDKSRVYDAGSDFSTFDDRDYCCSVCGAQTLHGSYCRRPVKGDTRCWQHSKQVFDMGSTISS